MDRDELIGRKEAVRAEIVQLRHRLEPIRAETTAGTGLRKRALVRRLHQIEARLDALMAEEASLRLLIDRSRT